MPGIEQYMTPINPNAGNAQPDWLKMIQQAGMVAPDQAQVASQNTGQVPPSLQANPAPMPVPKKSEGPNMSMGNPAPMVQNIPMVNNFPVGQGLNAYMPSATKSMDRALIDQYKSQSEKSMLEQQAGIDSLEQQRKDLAAQPQKVDWTSIASLVDAMNAENGHKTDLYSSALANRGDTQDQKNDKLLKLQEYIQGAKGGMSKESLQALQQELQMVHHNDQTNLMAQHYANEEKLTGQRNDIYGNRIQSGQELAAQRQMLNDPINKTYIPRMDGAVKIMDFIDGAERGDYKTNKAFLGQMNAEISRLETGSQSPGLNAGEKTEMTSQAAALKDVYDGITGGITGVDLSHKIDQARGMVGNLGQSYRQQIEARNRFIASGAQPSQAPIFESKANQWGRDLDDRISKLSPKSASALGIAPRSEDTAVVSNGKETLRIPRAHLADAIKDQYYEVK